MKEFILLLPIIFIFHDMEEIVGFEWFFRRNPDLYDRFPRVMKAYRNFKTEGFAAAVYEEFIPFFGVSLLAYYFPNKVLISMWYGLFLALAGHFLVHIGQTIYLKKYIPSFITSLICLPACVNILLRCTRTMTFDTVTILIIIVSILLMMLNLKMAHMLSHFVNGRMYVEENVG